MPEVPWYTRLALALALVSVASALVYALIAESCGGGAAGWAWVASIAGSVAMLLGLATLARGEVPLRSWLVAILAMLGGAGALLLAALTGFC